MGLHIMNNQEIAQEVLQRANIKKRQKERKYIKVAMVATVCCSVMVVVGLSIAMSFWVSRAIFLEGEQGSAVGSLVSSGTVCGAVVIGICSFLIGMGLMMLLHKWKMKL